MPWILDTSTGSLILEISGRWHPDHDLTRSVSAYYSLPKDFEGPVYVVMNSVPNPLPEFASLVSRQIFVGGTVRSILTEYQPDGIVFTEAIVTMPGGEVYGKPVYLLTFSEDFFVEDGIAIEGSDVKFSGLTHVRAPDGTSIPLPPRFDLTHQPCRLMWNRSAVEGRHLWADVRLRQMIAVSDTLYKVLKQNGVTGFQAQESCFATPH